LKAKNWTILVRSWTSPGSLPKLELDHTGLELGSRGSLQKLKTRQAHTTGSMKTQTKYLLQNPKKTRKSIFLQNPKKTISLNNNTAGLDFKTLSICKGKEIYILCCNREYFTYMI
jgi:hypothetical protein